MKAGLKGLLVIAVLGTAAADRLHAGLIVDLSFAAPVFHDEAWRPQRTVSPVGIGLRWDPEGWPVDLEARLQHERTREQNSLPLPVGHVAVDLLMSTASVGVVKARRTGTVRPYGGGGLEAILYRRYLFDNDFGGRLRDGGASPGLYASAGVLWPIGRRLVLGVEGRLFTGAKVSLTEVTVDPGVGFDLDSRERASTYREFAVRIGWRSSPR